MNNTITMEPQTPETYWLVETITEWWKIIVGAFGGIGVAYGFYRKYLKGKYKAISEWCSAAAAAPLAIVDIRKELEFGAGVSLREKLVEIGDNQIKMGHILSNEIANRRAALQHIETPLFEYDINGKFVWANDELLEIVECEAQQVLGDNWRNFIAGPEQSGVIHAWELAVKDGTDCRRKFRLATDGAEQWVLFRVSCNKDADGNVLGWIGNLKKIEDPRNAGGIHSTAN